MLALIKVVADQHDLPYLFEDVSSNNGKIFTKPFYNLILNKSLKTIKYLMRNLTFLHLLRN